MAKTETDHSKYRANMEEAMQKAAFPTQDMIDSLEAELRATQLTYLPLEAGLLKRTDGKMSVDTLARDV